MYANYFNLEEGKPGSPVIPSFLITLFHCYRGGELCQIL
jgi:hypothetical protein